MFVIFVDKDSSYQNNLSMTISQSKLRRKYLKFCDHAQKIFSININNWYVLLDFKKRSFLPTVPLTGS